MKSENIDINLSCKVLKVSRSGYYAYENRGQSTQSNQNELLVTKIHLIHEESRGTYGVPRVTAKLKKDGDSCSKNRVSRLMIQEGLSGLGKKKFKIKTTDSNHDFPIADRIFKTENKDTFPESPNKVWASDITYIPTDEGWLFLAVYLDLFTRKIVGYAMADNMRVELILKALSMALIQQAPDCKGLVSHSDRGSQYAAEECRKRLKLLGIIASMSRKGNCYDNAFAESFFSSLKVELIYRRKFKTRKEAMAAIFEYIETWYNNKRLHSSLGYLSPMEYERNHVTT